MSGDPPDTPPQHLGVYRLESALGRGGMGEVFLAWDERLERHVAIKRIRDDTLRDGRQRLRFRREARAVARLSHPAIVQIFDIFEADGGECIVMEYVEGDSLSKLLKESEIELGRAVRLGLEIAEGLAEAHGKGLVHRDLKPANVIVTPAGHAKILDFGLARRLWTDREETAAADSLTAPGALVGTAHAMSPEQASGHPVDHRSDLFALGGLIYQMVTGRPAFRGDTLLATLWQVTNEEPVSIAHLRPETPPELVDLVRRCLAKMPADRPRNARVVADELERVTASLSGFVPLQRAPVPADGHEAGRGSLDLDQPTVGSGVGAPSPSLETTATIRALLLTGPVGSEIRPSRSTFETSGASETRSRPSLEVSTRHDRAARDLLARFDGLEIEKREGFLLLFERPADAVGFALEYHRALDGLEKDLGLELRTAAAIHLSEVIVRRNLPQDVARGARPIEVEGLARPVLTGLLSVAQARQTLLSRTAFDLARRAFSEEESGERRLNWLAHGAYVIDGLAEPQEVFEVGEVDFAPLAAPPDAGGARRAVAPGDEITLGWRPAAGQTIPRRQHWVLRERVGQGGFGEVWLAVHEKTDDRRVFKFCFEAEQLRALQREVTLFRLLRESLGHRDDIARILDWDFDEAPYTLELDYTEGGNLKDWAAARGGLDEVALEVRFELVAQVAEALAAAHSVGVLHKDVKPENILISTDAGGRPRAVLTDFGIGVITDRDLVAGSAITELGLTEMTSDSDGLASASTPLYRAPELLAGMTATVQADIYALGVLLYQVVVADFGRPLAPGWRREIGDELLREDIASFADGTPQRRPGSALEVAERLRTLEERRATAAAERRARADAARARRRRRVLSTVAGVSTVFLVVVTFLAFQALRARSEAERARSEAEGLIDFMLFELRDSLEAIGRLDLLAKVAEGARQYFESLPNDREGAGETFKRATTFLNIGDVFLDQGETEAALASFQGARDLFSEALGEDPENAAWRQGLATSRLRLGDVLVRQGERRAALSEYRAAVDEAQRLVSKEPRDPGRRYDLAGARYKVAWWQSQYGTPDEALSTCQQALASAEELIQDAGEVPWRHHLLVINLRMLLGDIHRTRADWNGALAVYGAARELAASLAATDPAHAVWPRRLAWILYFSGVTQWRLGELEAALETTAAALAAFADQAARDPTRVTWPSALGGTQELIGRIHKTRGDLEAARDAYLASVEIYEDLAARDPTRVSWQLGLASGHQSVALVHLERGETSAALESFLAERRLRQGVAEVDPSDLDARNLLAWNHVKVGRVFAKLGAPDRARQEWARAVEIMEPVVASSDRATYLDTHVQALLELGRVDEARPLARALLARDWEDEDFLRLVREHGLRMPG